MAGVVALLGLWTILTPFLRFHGAGYAWNDWIVGIIVAILGSAGSRDGQGYGWIAGLVAVWLFIAGFIPGLHAAPGVFWNNILVGIVFAIVGFASVPRGVRVRPQ